jgi:diguanylate cyclase (GGDEF)-like protein
VLTWGLQIASFILFLVVLYKSIYTIKSYLFENIEELKNSLVHINQLAYYDQLTGLPNAYKFELDIKKNIEEHKKDGYIVIINLESLSLINSTLGYETGDQALIDVKDVFLKIKEEKEVVARTGGNEFSIWIEGISEKELHRKVSLIIRELKEQSVIRKKKFEFFSAYAKFIYGEDSFEDCYRKVTLTLTHVKSNRIYKVTSYNDKIEQIIRRKEKLKDLIEDAMDKGEFTLYYQAKCDSRTGEVIGVEALARWKSKKLGMISPYEFIPLVESINMSRKFGTFVIRRACRDFSALQKKYNENIKFSINISPSHIKDKSIVHTIRNALEEYQIPVNRLIIEITEDILIEGLEEVRGILSQLKELNVKISLDDFGTGYSSLNYLAQFEFDELKIDKTFIDQIENSKRTYILLDNIIRLSDRFNLAVVAEGVETKEQCDILAELGCYTIQGYYFARPESLYEENK